MSSKDNLLEDLRKELTTKIETYRQAINTLETDPIRELEEYTKSGKYNSNLGDLIIPLLSNQQKIRVVLLQQRDEEYVLEHEGHVYAPEGYEKTIYLEKEPLHYNALLPETRKSERKRTTEGGKELESEAERSVKENTNKVMVEKDVTDKKVEETQVNTQENTQENSEEENQEAPLQTEKEEKCSICGEEWQGFHIECSTCQTWYHGECVGVNEDEIEEKEEYTCPSCAKEKKKLDKEESKYYRDREQEIKKQHKTKVEKLNQKITSLTEDIKKRKTKMEEKDDCTTQQKNEIARMKKINDEQTKNIEELKKEKEGGEKTIRKLRDEVGRLRKEINLSATKNRTIRIEHEVEVERITTELENTKAITRKLEEEKERILMGSEDTDEEDQSTNEANEGGMEETAEAKDTEKDVRDTNSIVNMVNLKTVNEQLKSKIKLCEEYKKETKSLITKKNHEINLLKEEVKAYEERLETALTNSSQKEKENKCIIENHENLQRIYKELL